MFSQEEVNVVADVSSGDFDVAAAQDGGSTGEVLEMS